MSELRPSTALQRRQLKAVVRRSVEMAGGVSSFEHVTRVKAPALSKYCSPDDELHMPVDVLLDLMLDTRSNAVLSAIAGMLGYGIVALDLSGQKASLPDMADIAELVRENSVLVTAVTKAVADGHITAAEEREISDEIEKSVQELRGLQRKVTNAAVTGGAT